MFFESLAGFVIIVEFTVFAKFCNMYGTQRTHFADTI